MSKRKLLVISFVICLMLMFAACGSPPAESEVVTVNTTVEVPVTVEVIQEVESIVEVEITRLVEVTRIVEVVAEQTVTPAPEPLSGDGEKIGMNYVAEAEIAGLRVEIARVVIANKEDVPQDFSFDPSFDDIDVVGELVFIVTNNSDKTISVYPDQATVQINSELVDLFDYFYADFGDSVGGDIPPGVKLIGGQWFGIKRNQVADVNELIVRFSCPYDAESFDCLGEDFEIVIDVSAHTNEPLPDEFK